MFAIGAGIGGFFGGILLADIGAKMATAAGFDGSNLAALMQNFIASFAGVDETALLVMGGLLAAGAVIGAMKGMATAGGVALGMSAIGMGIAGFFSGLNPGSTYGIQIIIQPSGGAGQTICPVQYAQTASAKLPHFPAPRVQRYAG